MARIASTPGAGTENLVVGKVLILYGTVKAIAEDGTVRLLGPNSPIYANEHIVTESDGSVSIQFAGPPVTQLDLGRMTEIVIDEDVYAGVVPEAVSDAAAQAEQIQEALLEGDQPIELEATAAGGGTGAGGGHPTVVFDLTGNEVTPGSGAETTGVNFSTVDTLHGVFDESGGGTPYVYPGVVTLTATETITEAPGQLITYTATVDNPPHDSNLVLTLDNNLTITIAAGETTGRVTATFGGNEDVYVDSGVIPVSIVGAAGGNYTSLDASDTASTAVVDTIDTTLVSLTAGPALMTEDGAVITYTVTLTNEVRVGDDPVTVTFNDLLGTEHTITITGGTIGSVDVAVPESVFEDVYAEDPTGLGKLTAEDISVTGGNYENLMIGAVNTQVTLSDSIDTTTVSLAASPVLMTENGATITYTATLTNAVRVGDEPVTVTFNDLLGTEHTITITGGTTGSAVVTVAESVFEDVYAEDPAGLGKLTAEDISVAGGSYENLMIGSVNTQVTLSDSIDTTTVSLAAGPALMTEDGAVITYTATLTNAVRVGDDPVTVTFNDLLGTEHTITITGGTIGSVDVTVAESVFEDVYAEDPTGLGKLTAEDISVTGGNYENLMIGAVNTQVTLSDSIDTTTVSLAASPVLMTEDGAVITYTATLTNAVRVGDDPVTVTFNDLLGAEHTITITGGTTGSVDVTVAESVFEDVYAENPTGLGKLLPDDIDVAGGNYENLIIGSVNTQVTLSDTIDTVTATLTASAPGIPETGGDITYTVTLSGGPGAIDPDNPLTFNLANGDQITINPGATFGSYTRNYSAAEISGQTVITNSITGIASGGGEYEHLDTAGTVATEITDGGPTAYDDSKDIDESGLRGDGTESVSGTVVFDPGLDVPVTLTADLTTLHYGTATFDPLTGNWTYTLTAPVTDGPGPETDSFTYTVTDSDGSPSTGTVTITIIDDVPTAFADSGTTSAGQTLTVPQVLGVLTNDTIGADAAGSVVGLAQGDTGVDSTGTMTATGLHGTLTIATDGSYSYMANNVVSVESQDVFTYTMQDGDGDYSHATLTIGFTGDNSVPVAYDSSENINESGLLPDGTESVSGTVVFDPGLDVPVTLTADLTSLHYGTVDFNAATGGWTYTLTAPVTDGPGAETDSFTYTVTDSDGSPSTGTVTITIIDDVPKAFADSGTATEGQTLTVPQLLGVLSNDTIGADAAGMVVGLATGDTGVDSTGTMTATGLYGTLTIAADGSYSYVAKASVNAESQDVFTYTMQDGDGDFSHATLTIGFIGDNNVPYAYDDSKDINESGLLPDGTESVSGTVVFDPGLDVPVTLTADLTTLHYGTATFDPLTGNWTYTLTAPVTDGPGAETDSFTYTVTDSDGSPSTGTVTITIIDDVPKAFADSGTVKEGGTLTVPQVSGVLANDVIGADAPGSVVGLATGDTGVDSTGTMTAIGLYGTLTIAADGNYSYVAKASVDDGSQDVFTYTIQDGDGDYSHATLTISFTGDSNVPTAYDDSKDIDESGLRGDGTESVSGTVVFDPGLDVPVTLTADLTTLHYGTATFDPLTGNWTYTLTSPVTDGPGPETDSFTYTVTDSDGSPSTGTVTITIIDDVPTAFADSGTTSAGQTLTVPQLLGVLVNDTIGADAAGSVVGLAQGDTGVDSTGIMTVTGLHGTLTIAADGSYSYVANNVVSVESQDVFTYTMQDGDGDYSHATLTINFEGDNSVPYAHDDSKDIDESGLRGDGTESVSGTVVYDPGLDVPVTLTADLTSLHYGTATFDPLTGNWTYTLTAPVTDGPGAETDSFTYTVTDSDGSPSTGTVTITIIDDVPKAFADSGTTSEGHFLTVPQVLGVLANDTIGADAAGTVVGLAQGDTGVDSTGSASAMTAIGLFGALTINADGSYSYVANASVDDGSQDVFTYTIQDGDGDYSHATLTIGFKGDNNVPAAYDSWKPIEESGLRGDGTESVSGTVDFSPGLDLPVTLEAHDDLLKYGTLNFNTTTGEWTYTLTAPVMDGPGSETDVFHYTVTDSDGSSRYGTVTIVIKDDVPTAFADSGTTSEGHTITIPKISGVLANDIIGADVAGVVVGLAAGDTAAESHHLGTVFGQHGVLMMGMDGSYQYDAYDSVDAGTQDVFTYTMRDHDGDYSHATLTITFAGDNNVPTAYDSSENINESGLLLDGTESVSGTVVYDPGLDVPVTLTADLTSLHYGTVDFNMATGGWTYTLTAPVTDGPGQETDSFTYTVTDSDGSPSTGTVTITIIDDVPKAFADSGTTTEGGTITAPQVSGVLANDTLSADATVLVVGLEAGNTNADSTGAMMAIGLFGTLTIAADGSYSYVANASVNAGSQDVFTYTIQDGDGDFSHATLTIGFTGDNNFPQAYDDFKIIEESGLRADGIESVGGMVAFNPGPDLPPTLAADDSGLQYGTLNFNTTTGAWTYTLTAPVPHGSPGQDPVPESFTYTVTDSDGTPSTGTVTITIIDDVPAAFADSGTAIEGQTLTVPQVIGVLANDTIGADAAGMVVGLSAGDTGMGTIGTMTVIGLYGELTIAADGSYSYVANGSVNAGSQDVFTYTMQDGDGDFSHATLTINFPGDNNVPSAHDDAQDINESGLRGDGTESVSGTVVFDPGLDVPVTLTADLTSLHYGTVVFDAANGGWTYTLTAPVTDGPGPETDSFTYTVTDSDGSPSTGTVTITIIDDVPTAFADSGAATEGQTLTVPQVLGVLVNDTIGADAAGSVVGLATGDTGVDSTGMMMAIGLFGTLTIAADGSYSYLANSSVDAGSQDMFTYTIQDGDGDFSHATLTIGFTGDGNVPTAYDDAKDINEAGLRADGTESVSGTVAFDPGLDVPATLAADDSGLQHGALNFNTTTGEWIYTLTAPVTDGPGAETDSFTYTVTDSDGSQSTGTVTITIIDDVPTAVADSGTATEGQTLTMPQVNGVLANDTIGADAAGLVVGLAAGNTGVDSTGTMAVTGLHGTLTIAADGSYSYVADSSVNAGSQDVFTYTMQDGDGDFSHATLTINFPGDHNVPSAGETIAFVDDEGLSNGIPGGTGDIVVTPDADANEATFSGTLSFNFGGDGPGSVTFEAMNGATGHIGTEDVTYAWDSGSGVLTATVSGGERDGLDLFTVQVTDPLTGQYTVTLLDNVLHEAGGNENNAMADLTYTVTDANNDADTGSLTVTFNDDMPAAYSMSPEVKQGSFSTGNLLSDSSPDGSFGADEGHVTSIAAVGSTKSPNFDNVITEDTPNDFDLFVVGKYGGKLMVDSDTGDYEYKAPLLSNPGAKTETFEFTVTDSDGDTATAQLNMMLDDPNDGTP